MWLLTPYEWEAILLVIKAVDVLESPSLKLITGAHLMPIDWDTILAYRRI